jgi:hypothetical protein
MLLYIDIASRVLIEIVPKTPRYNPFEIIVATNAIIDENKIERLCLYNEIFIPIRMTGIKR